MSRVTLKHDGWRQHLLVMLPRRDRLSSFLWCLGAVLVTCELDLMSTSISVPTSHETILSQEPIRISAQHNWMPPPTVRIWGAIQANCLHWSNGVMVANPPSSVML